MDTLSSSPGASVKERSGRSRIGAPSGGCGHAVYASSSTDPATGKPAMTDLLGSGPSTVGYLAVRVKEKITQVAPAAGMGSSGRGDKRHEHVRDMLIHLHQRLGGQYGFVPSQSRKMSGDRLEA